MWHRLSSLCWVCFGISHSSFPLPAQSPAHPARGRSYLLADAPTFFTFATLERRHLSPAARKVALEACLHWDGKKIEVYAVVVMPDHVHLICSFHRDKNGELIPFREILQSIKGYSAYELNRQNGQRGSIWQDESFDRVIRVHDDLRTKVEYVIHNPVRWNLAAKPEEYPWLYVSPFCTA